ncbi:MAG: response regulator [Treponema sp.]|jgi:PleD family two-component response regulator|nr:response regulator [Treponema sp.]
MKDINSKNFDLLTLLKLGDLDIRSISEDFDTLSVKEYFNLLSDFFELAPVAISALDKIVGLNAEKDSFKSLKDMKNLLRSLGYNKCTPVIEGILNASEKGNMDLAADWAKKFFGDFKRLYTRTLTAVKKEYAYSYTSNVENVNYLETYGTQNLKVALEQIDNGEATRKLRILAVDDAPVMLKTISSTLGTEYKVYTLSNSMMVESFLQQVTPELFLLDYKMPGLNGFDLIPIIRNFEEHKDTPIIFLTSVGTSDNVSAAAMLGASDFIIKPFQGNILREKIAKHIVRKKTF